MKSLRRGSGMMDFRKATPHNQLIEELMDSGRPHSELEWAARREIASLREKLGEIESIANRDLEKAE